MPSIEKITRADDNTLEVSEQDPEQAYCSTTNRIVIVSSFPRIVHDLARELSSACYDVMVFHHGDLELLSQLQPDLLIVDETRQDEAEGKAWLANSSKGMSDVPVLHLLKPGADAIDGYNLLWPSPLDEALLVIRSLMGIDRPSFNSVKSGGSKPAAPQDSILQLKDLTLDLKRYMVHCGTVRVNLTKTEFDLLRAIMEAEGSTLSRQELMDRVWGEGYFGGSNIVDVHVKTLRHKLNDSPRSPRYVTTVRGIGYRAAD